MAINFPTGEPNIPDAALTGESLGTMHGGAGHPAATNRLILNIKALAAKLGYGTSLPGASAGVLRRNGTGTSEWGQVQAADLGAGLGSAVSVLLNFNETADLFSASTWTANVPQPFGAAKAFTVQSATSVVEIGVRCAIFSGTAPAVSCETLSYLLIDGTTRYNLGSSGSNATGNPFAGAGPVFISGLSAGAHTVQVFGFSNQNTTVWYCRCGSQPSLEWFGVQVIEHKIGVGLQGVQGPPGDMTNPMTAVDDIIIGSTGGAPMRRAKGANNTVLVIGSGGVLQWAQLDNTKILPATILGASIAPQTLLGGNSGAASHLAFGTITGSQAGANSNIAAGTITGNNIQDGTLGNADLAAQTLRGGVDGAASRIVPGSLTYQDLAAASATQILQSAQFSQANSNPPWTWISGGAQVSITTIGMPVLVIMSGSMLNSTVANALAYVGHAQNSNTTASYTQNVAMGPINSWMPYCVMGIYQPPAGSYTYYGTCGTSSGSLLVNGYMMAIELRR